MFMGIEPFRRRRIVALVSASLFAACAAISSEPAHADISDCLDNGICYHVSNTGYPDFDTQLSFSGQPRVRDYVTKHYNVVVHNYHVNKGRQFELSMQWNPIRLPGTVNVSVQACRKRTFARSLCTPWSTFKVY